MSPMNYTVLAYYQFSPLMAPHQEVQLHKAFLGSLDAKARIYISEQGINGQMSAKTEDAKRYMEWMHARDGFKNLHFKQDLYHEQAFPKLTIKYRKQLVALDRDVDLSQAAPHISPEEFKKALEAQEKPLVLDVRNDYEWAVGRFEGAELPPCENFREFNAYAEQLKTKIDPKVGKVVMYCTGGIRCELYSSLLKEAGFENVFQLQGGVINYGHEVGSSHWQGKLFVFDDRLTVPLGQDKTETIGQCHHCETPNDLYYNCANMDCNRLFLCCPSCLPLYAGCCQDSCKSAKRIRPYEQQNAHKPFRKKHHYVTS